MTRTEPRSSAVPDGRPLSGADLLAAACFFLSGAAGLVYEVCWIRRGALVFGSTTLAVSTVVAVFFLGLALGSWGFGKLADRTARPLRLVALLELGVVLLALASPALFDAAEGLYGRAYRAPLGGAPLALLRALLVCAVVLPPTVLMGGTLPLFCRHYVVRAERIAAPVGVLYGLNTLGAACGCLAAGLVLLPALGLQRTLWVGAGASLVAGLGLLALGRGATPRAAPPAPSPAARGGSRGTALLAGLFFTVGFSAIGFEVLVTRYLGLILRRTVATYTLSLAIVLLGIVLGSLAGALLIDRLRAGPRTFGALQVGAGLVVLALLGLPPAFWLGVGERLWVHLLLFLPSAVLSGASFPLAMRMAIQDPARAGAAVGRFTALNTAGGIAGSLLTGFVGLPLLGMQTSLLVLSATSVACGVAAWLFLAERTERPRLAPALACIAWLGIPWLNDTRLPADHLAAGRELVDLVEGHGADLTVIAEGGERTLEIDRWWQGTDELGHQALAAHVPMLLHGDARSVLVVGIGTGQTTASFLEHPIQQLDCVDIEPRIFRFVRRNFGGAWWDDPRLATYPEDGRSFILHTATTYDVISLEVGQVFRPGIAFFYTRDFYAAARERLVAGGLLTQFVPLAFFEPEELAGVVATFRAVFPSAVLWFNTAELLLIGVNADRLAPPPGLRARLAAPELSADLSLSYWGGPAQRLSDPVVFLSGFLCGPAGLARLAEGGAVYRDDRPVLDYSTRRVDPADPREPANVELLRTCLDPPGAWLPLEPAEEARAEALRAANLGSIVAEARLRQAELAPPEQGLAFLFEAVEACPGHAEAHRRLGDALLRSGRLEEATAELERAVAIVPEDGEARHALGFALMQLGRDDEALAQYRRAVESRPDDAELHNNLGVLQTRRRELESALEHFEAAARLDPRNGEARRNAAEVRRALEGSAR